VKRHFFSDSIGRQVPSSAVNRTAAANRCTTRSDRPASKFRCVMFRGPLLGLFRPAPADPKLPVTAIYSATSLSSNLMCTNVGQVDCRQFWINFGIEGLMDKLV